MVLFPVFIKSKEVQPGGKNSFISSPISKKKKTMERGIGKTKKYDICSTKDVSSR